MSEPPIYLDCNSTTPIDRRVVEAMKRAWRDHGANPASQHSLGRKARRVLEDAREGIAELLGARTGGMDADQVIFTSGGTEANNLALCGLISTPLDKNYEEHTRKCFGADVLISSIEHPSIIAVAQELKRLRVRVEAALPVDASNCISDELVAKLDDLPQLCSVMLANNETGIVHPINEIADQCSLRVAAVHTDAVQAVGKTRVNFGEMGVHAMTVAPHKFHGPVGIGALVLFHGVELQPQLFGGFQQGGLRPGTENVPLAVGFHEALKLAVAELPERSARMQSLRDQLEQSLRTELTEMVIIGENSPRLPNTSCVSFPGVDRQALVMALDLAGVACSTGSACASGSSEPSPTLVAMGLPKAVVDGAIRFSLGAFTTGDEIAEASRRIIKTVNHLRAGK
jgi:cysteine desulfurase